MPQLKTIYSYFTYYSKSNNEYKEVDIVSTTAHLADGKVTLIHKAADGNTYDTLYMRAKGAFHTADITSDVYASTMGSCGEPIYYDEAGFYANALAIDGTRTAYKHYLGFMLEFDHKTHQVNKGDFVGEKQGEDAVKFFEEYTQINADGSVEEHKSKKSKVYLNDEELAFVKGKLAELFEYCKEHDISLFDDHDSGAIFATHGIIDYGSTSRDLEYSQVVGKTNYVYDGCTSDYGVSVK